MRIAEIIVESLLDEGIRACAACQREHGVTPEPGTSHGMCKRHTIAQLQELLDVTGPDPETQALIDRYASKPDNDPSFAPGIA